MQRDQRQRELRIHFIPCLTDLNWTMKNTSRNEREIRLQLANAAAHPHGEEKTSLTTMLTCLNACESIQHMKSLSVHRIRIQNHHQVRENCSETKHERNHKDTEETQNLDWTDCSEAWKHKRGKTKRGTDHTEALMGLEPQLQMLASLKLFIVDNKQRGNSSETDLPPSHQP